MRLFLLLAASLLPVQSALSPQQPARDTVRRADPTGTGVIRGRVITADTGLPVRRASVTLSSSQPSRASLPSPPTPPDGRGAAPAQGSPATSFVPIRPRQAVTDMQGAFEFAGLPAGTYRVSAFPGQFGAQYIGLAYGAKRPTFDPGLPIDLGAGAVFDKAIIVLPRGGVVTGRVTDDDGMPLARVQVYGLWYQPGSTRGQRNNSGGMTDDLGQFRLYGLQPGEYAIVAQAMMSTWVSPNMDVQSSGEEDRLGFVTTFFPGTPDETTAQRVRAVAGAETTGIEIRLVSGRLLRVSGMVSDSQGKPIANANGQLGRRAGPMGVSNYGFTTDSEGRFQMRNIAPGNYRLVVHQRQRVFSSDGTSSDPGEVALVPLSLVDNDMENVAIVTSPGATVKGQIVFEHAPASTLRQLRIAAVPPDQDYGGITPPSAIVQPDLTFTLTGVVGEYLLRTGAPGVWMKSVSTGSEDITDTPHEFKSRERVTIVMTARASILEGTLTDASGAPAVDAGILLFTEDKAGWRANSLRTRRGGPDQTGHFQLTGLMPGRYYIVAAPRERLNVPPNVEPSFFEALAKDATTIVINDDEQRTVDLKVVTGAGGGGNSP